MAADRLCDTHYTVVPNIMTHYLQKLHTINTYTHLNVQLCAVDFHETWYWVDTK